MAREFNPQELGEIQKLTSSITKEMDRMLSQTDKRNKQLDDEIKATKEILENVTDEKEAREAIGKLKKQQEENRKNQNTANKATKPGEMTQEEARRLLQALEDNDKLYGLPPQIKEPHQKPERDW